MYKENINNIHNNIINNTINNNFKLFIQFKLIHLIQFFLI